MKRSKAPRSGAYLRDQLHYIGQTTHTEKLMYIKKYVL